MTQLFRSVNQILLVLVLIFSIKSIDSVVNYKLTAFYDGLGGLSMDIIGNLSLWVGKRQTVVTLFTDWCNDSMNKLFDIQLNNIWTNKSIPLITWQITGCNGTKQPGVMKLVRNHTYDIYINQFGDRLKSWLAGNDGVYGTNDDRRVYIRLGMTFQGKGCYFHDIGKHFRHIFENSMVF
jgi:hypothetical protein